MSQTLLSLKIAAEDRLKAGKLIDALKVYRLLLEAAPLDFNLRMQIADICAAQDNLEADTIYNAVADHDIKSGHPLRAMVALKLLRARGVEVTPRENSLISKYSSESSCLGNSVKPAPTDWSTPIRDNVDIDYNMDKAKVMESVAQMAAYTENIQNYPDILPPLAIFSTLDENSFSKLLELLELKRFEAGEKIIKEGDSGDALYFVARGEVRIVKKMTRPDEDETTVQLARLGPGSLFGEMALVSDDPRGASVICKENVDVLKLKKDLANELAAQIPNVAEAIARFTRDRLISNLLAVNPLFSVFDDASRKQLLARFTGHEVPTGTIFIEQGKAGAGLYLILRGNAEVLKWSDGEYLKIADLSSGAILGEISLINEEPSTATVRTTSPATLLFLARELFYPLVEAVPALRDHFAKMANDRINDTAFKLMQNHVLNDDFIESLEITDDNNALFEDDLICI